MKKFVCGMTATLIAIFSFSVSASAEKVIFSDIEYKTIDNGQGMIDDSLAEYAYSRWNNSLSSSMTSSFIEGYSEYGIHTYYLDSSLTELNFTYSSEYGYYYSDLLTVLYVSNCQSDRGLAGGSNGFSGYLYYYPQQDAWAFLDDVADSSISISKYTNRDLRSTIVFNGIDGISSSASIDVSVSPLSDEMNVDVDKNFVFKLINNYSYPVQFIVYVSPFSSAVSADYAIKSLHGNGGIYVTEMWRYVLAKSSFVTASDVSSLLPATMFIPKFELNFISKISDTCYDCTQYVPAGGSYSFSADWTNFCSIVPDETYYFNVVACFLPDTADKPFRDKSNDFSPYTSIYSQSFKFVSSSPDFTSPTTYTELTPATNSVDLDVAFEKYLQDNFNISTKEFNTYLQEGNKTITDINNNSVDVNSVFASFMGMVNALGGVVGGIGNIVDDLNLGFSALTDFDTFLNYTNSPKATMDNDTLQITVKDNSRELSDYYKDYYSSQNVNNAPTFNNSNTITVTNGSGTGTGLDIPDVDLTKYIGVLNRYPSVLSFVKTSMDFVPDDFWELAFLAIILSIFLLLIGRN